MLINKKLIIKIYLDQDFDYIFIIRGLGKRKLLVVPCFICPQQGTTSNAHMC